MAEKTCSGGSCICICCLFSNTYKQFPETLPAIRGYPDLPARCAQVSGQPHVRSPGAAIAATYLAMQCTAMAMHFIHQFGHRLGRRELRNSVAQIEHVTTPAHRPVRIERATRFGPDGLCTAEQRHR